MQLPFLEGRFSLSISKLSSFINTAEKSPLIEKISVIEFSLLKGLLELEYKASSKPSFILSFLHNDFAMDARFFLRETFFTSSDLLNRSFPFIKRSFHI